MGVAITESDKKIYEKYIRWVNIGCFLSYTMAFFTIMSGLPTILYFGLGLINITIGVITVIVTRKIKKTVIPTRELLKSDSLEQHELYNRFLHMVGQYASAAKLLVIMWLINLVVIIFAIAVLVYAAIGIYQSISYPTGNFLDNPFSNVLNDSNNEDSFVSPEYAPEVTNIPDINTILEDDSDSQNFTVNIAPNVNLETYCEDERLQQWCENDLEVIEELPSGSKSFVSIDNEQFFNFNGDFLYYCSPVEGILGGETASIKGIFTRVEEYYEAWVVDDIIPEEAKQLLLRSVSLDNEENYIIIGFGSTMDINFVTEIVDTDILTETEIIDCDFSEVGVPDLSVTQL